MSSIKHKPHGRDTADETACAGRDGDRRTTITRLARVVACAVCAVAAGGLLASASSGAPSLPAAAGSVAAAPALAVKPARVHQAAKATIGLFTAVPARLPASGGKVRLVAVVQGAASCRFSSTTPLGQLPSTKPCSSGHVSFSVELPRNHSSSSRTYRFHLTATSAGSSANAGPAWVVEEGAASSTSSAPAITTDPTGRSVAAGKTVSFTAAARGKPAPSVSWQVSANGGRSWSTIAHATASTYSFRAQDADSGNEYRAVFTNALGSARTTVATLRVVSPTGTAVGTPGNAPAPTVQVAPSVTTQPANESVVSGASVTFRAAASADPAPSVRWQVSSDGGASWSAIPGATAVSYSLTALTSDSGEQFRAVFTNAAGSATSNAVTLTVSAPTAGSAITTQPSSLGVVSGATASFTATASGAPAPSVQWQVSTDGGTSWTPISGATSTTLSFTALQSDSGYEYEAVFTNSAGSATTSAATLTIYTAPTLSLNPSSATVAAGLTVSLSAAASGTPAPSVQWQVSTNGGGNWTPISGATSTTLSFTALESDNGDEYEAVFTNSAGSATTSAATLTVTAAPAITTQPSEAALVSGATASFTAGASGSPTPTVQWYVSTNGGGSWGKVTGAGATSTTYSFATSGSENGYEYEAEFTNPSGTATTNPATLVVGADSTFVNWSGYAVTGAADTVTEATGSWSVPSVNCSGAGTTYESEWVGIDGYQSTNHTVEQDGTDSDCAGGSPSYYAWYEMYPSASNELSYPVAAGDSMTATISVSGSSWTLTLVDHTKSWTSQTSVSSGSVQQSSAEWVVERPEVGGSLSVLSNFGSTGFSGASATIDGESGSIAYFSGTPFEMEGENGTTLLALPGPLGSGGSSFTDTFYNSN
jgi:Peptidase A4 family/Immunoglobulin I-set domain